MESNNNEIYSNNNKILSEVITKLENVINDINSKNEINAITQIIH